MSKDEREQDSRLLLNLGHTFGHAMEADLGYDNRLLHGEAVAIGSIIAFSYFFNGISTTQSFETSKAKPAALVLIMYSIYVKYLR